MGNTSGPLVPLVFLGETLGNTLDIFIVLLAASLVELILLATRGIPITYPVILTKKEQLIFIIIAPFLGAVVPLKIMLITQSIEGFMRALGIYAGTFLILLVLVVGYKAIVLQWEKHHLE